jgi:hypothetical protein
MSFGFSVGDFLAVTRIIIEVSKSLREAGGSKSEYQELQRELDLLKVTLGHLEGLEASDAHHGSGNSGNTIDSIRYAALACRQPLEEFLLKVKKYEDSLGQQSTSSKIGTAVCQIKWLRKKEDISKLQAYLAFHIGTINMLLSQHGLARISQLEDQSRVNQEAVVQSLQATRDCVEQVRERITDQDSVMRTVRDSHSILGQLRAVVLGDFGVSWKAFGDMVSKTM